VKQDYINPPEFV